MSMRRRKWADDHDAHINGVKCEDDKVHPTKQLEVTEEQLDMLKYFWEEKEDVTRYTEWGKPTFMAALQREYPEIVHAVTQLDIAKRTLTAVLERASYNHLGD